MKITKHGPVERVLGAVLIFFAALGPAHATASAPAAPVVHAAPQATLPLNDVLRGEWDIALGRLADGTNYECRIPYVNVYNSPVVSPAYAARLKHNEDPRNGVTVNAVLTDPAGATHTYPCWYGEDMTVDMSGGKGDQQGDHLQVPAGYAGWHLAFPCKTLGGWSGHLAVADAGGIVSGPTFSFTVAGQLAIPDAAKGRLSVSAADPRYLKYDDGDAYLPLGETGNGSHPVERLLTHLAAGRAAHARTLLRTFTFALGGGFPLTGDAGGSDGDFGSPTLGVIAGDAHSGRYAYKVTSYGGTLGGGQASPEFAYYSPPGQAQRFGVWVKDVGAPAGTRVGITQYGNYGTGTLTATDTAGADIHDGAWHYVSGILGGAAESPKLVYLTVQGADGAPNATGYFLFDDLCICEQSHDPAAGPGSAWDLLGGEGDYEFQNTLDESASAGLDTFLGLCRQGGADMLLEMYDKGDFSQVSVSADGALANGADSLSLPLSQWAANVGYATLINQFGAYSSGPSGASDDGCETAVGLFHAQQARAWVARFGCYVGQGIAYVAYGNETEPTGPGGQEQLGAEHWAVQMRSVAPLDCLPLCGSDTYFNATGVNWLPNLYESPWLQFAEPHISASGPNGTTGTYATPLNMTPNGWLQPGIVRHATGGPSGRGYVEYAQGARPNPSLPGLPLATLRTPGTWTVSCYALTVPDAAGRPYAGGQENSMGQTVGVNSLYVQGAGVAELTGFDVLNVPASGLAAWTKLTGTFTLASMSQSPQLDFRNDQTAGGVRYADITITDPQGRVFWQFEGDEPDLDAGGGDAVAVWGAAQAVGVSGGEGAARPVVIGESEAYYGSPDVPTGSPFYAAAGPAAHVTAGPGGTTASNSVAYPMSQYAMRAAAAMVDARWHPDTLWCEDSAAVDVGGYGAFFHTMQSLLDGFLAPDGTWREVVTAQSGFAGPGEPFVVYGQENSRDAASGAVVDATRAVVSVLPLQPDPGAAHAFLPGTGLVDLQGLADAPYTVQEYDAPSGRLVATLTASSAGHHLSLNFSSLASGVVVKVSPVSAPALALRLAVDHATANPGDVVTYTLTYTNTGTGPALAVTVPWAVPAHMRFLSASGGTYDGARNVVNWDLGTLAPGASGSVVLRARVE